MKRVLICLAVIFTGASGLYLASRPSNTTEGQEAAVLGDAAPEATPKKISAQEAKDIMDNSKPYILLDVRTEEEFIEEHIDGAVLLPSPEIRERAEVELADKNGLIMVYCRTGGRSAIAAQELAEMGYSDVYDIGGIVDWPYDKVSK